MPSEVHPSIQGPSKVWDEITYPFQTSMAPLLKFGNVEFCCYYNGAFIWGFVVVKFCMHVEPTHAEIVMDWHEGRTHEKSFLVILLPGSMTLCGWSSLLVRAVACCIQISPNNVTVVVYERPLPRGDVQWRKRHFVFSQGWCTDYA